MILNLYIISYVYIIETNNIRHSKNTYTNLQVSISVLRISNISSFMADLMRYIMSQRGQREPALFRES